MRFLYLVALIGICFPVFSQIDGDYRSRQTGSWENAPTWEVFNLGTWHNLEGIGAGIYQNVIPSASSGAININGNTVTITTSISADQIVLAATNSSKLLITGTLSLNDGPGDEISMPSGDRNAQGTVEVSTGTLIFNEGCTLVNSLPSKFIIGDGGTYQHNYETSAGTIYPATWSTGATLAITGYTTHEDIAPSGLNQTFHNVVWNCPNSTGFFINLNGALDDIDNDFSIIDTGGTILSISDQTAYTLRVGGDLIVGPEAIIFFNYLSTAITTVNIGGNFDWDSGPSSALSDYANSTFSIGGGLIVRSGSTLSLNGGESGSGSVSIDLSGDLIIETSATLTKSSAIGAGTTELSFVAEAPTIQVVSNAGSITNAINFSLEGGTLDLGTSVLSGSGVFVCTGEVRVGSLSSSGAVVGNIPITKTFNSPTTITYNGVAAQSMGNHHSDAGVIINNSGGVSLVADTEINGGLTLTSGNLSVGARTLTLAGIITPNENFITVSSSSSLVINGSGVVGNFPFPSGDQTISNFTLNRSAGGVTFANNVTITGTVALTNGSLIFSDKTLTLNGTFSATSGALYGNSSSILSVGGSGAFGELIFHVDGSTINTLTFNRSTSGTGSINSTLAVTNQLNLSNGDFTNTTGLTLANGATVTRNSSARLLGDNVIVASGEHYHVVYTGGALTTGVELPNTTNDDLMHLTVNGGPVTLDKNIIVNGDVTLQNGTLSATGFNITMAGNPAVWNRQSGSFAGGTGSVIVSGNLTIQGSQPPRFGNLTVNSGATLTLPSLINIDGILQLDASSTFNHNNGTVRLNGSAAQTIAGAGKTFNNIAVDKSAGTVQFSSNVNLIGGLTVFTATTVDANGSLTLLSTSDDASGNAYIGALPSGASVIGNVTAERYMSSEGRIYRYISSPVAGAPVSALQDHFPITGSFTGTSYPCSGCTNNPSMFYYDETTVGVADEGYVAFPSASNTETLQVGQGYTPFVRQNVIGGPVTIDLTGTVNQGTISLPVTYTNTGDESADGYNLVGNPFPSTIDWDIVEGWSKTNMSKSIAVMDNGSGGVFRYWNGSAGEWTNGLIAAGQGFWVQATGSNPVLQVNEQAKTTTTGVFFRGRPKDINVLEIALSHGAITDKTYFQVSNEASDDLDALDARKLNNVSFDLGILSKNGVRMAINATNRMPNRNESIRLHIKDMPKGTFRLALNKSGQFAHCDYFLLDRYLNKSVDLQAIATYNFSVTTARASYAADRFELFMFRSGKGKNLQALMDETPEGESVQIFPNPAADRLYVKSSGEPLRSVTLLSSVGMTMESAPIVGVNEQHWEGYFDLSNLPGGIYFVRVVNADHTVTIHKVLKE